MKSMSHDQLLQKAYFYDFISRPGKLWNFGVDHGKSWKMTLIVQN